MSTSLRDQLWSTQLLRTGIWTKHLKAKTNLHQTVIDRCLKTLVQKRLIKRVPSVQHPTRKIYMLEGIEPSIALTGGPWYTDNELDTEFIQNLTEACYKFISDLVSISTNQNYSHDSAPPSELPQTEGSRSRSTLPHLQRTTIPYRPAHQELSPESAADGDRPHSRTRGDAPECAGSRRKDRESEFASSIGPAVSHPDHHPSFQRSAAPFGIHPRLEKIRTTMATGGVRKSENVTPTMKTIRGKSGSGRNMPSAATTRAAPPTLVRGRSAGESAPRTTPTLTTAIRMKRGRRRRKRKRGKTVTIPRRPARTTAQMTSTRKRRRRRRKRSSRSRHRKVTTRNLADRNPPSALPLPQQHLTNTIPAQGAPSIVLSNPKQYSSDGPRHPVRYAPPLISVKTVGL